MTHIVPSSNNSHLVRLGRQTNPIIYDQGSVAPRRFDQLSDVNMIGVQDGDIVSYDAETGTYIPISRNDYVPNEINLVYVSKNGNDSNSGRSIQEAKLTIEAAVAISSESTVIRVSPGNYTVNNPITFPDQVSIIGNSLREVSISCQNQADLFYVGNGNYIAELSFVGSENPNAIVSFDPVGVRYINQSPYVQNCTNFIPNSIGMKINGQNAIGPIKSMVLDSYTQYNQGGIGVSITNSGYAQLVSLFTICNKIGVYCGTGGACDLTNSNSSFGDFGLVSDGVSPLQYVGIITETSSVNFDSFVVRFNNPVYNISNAFYDNNTGILTGYTTAPHGFSVGMAVSLSGLGFACTSGPTILNYPSGNKGYVFNTITVAPGRYVDSYNLIQLNKEEIINSSYDTIATTFPGFINPSPDKCKRDLGYFVDNISHDIRDYTNKNSIQFLKAYFDQEGNFLSNGLQGEVPQTIVAFHSARDLMKLAITNNLTNTDLNVIPDPLTNSNVDLESCSDIQTFIDNLVGIVTTGIGSSVLNVPSVSMASTVFSVYVGVSTLAHTYNSGGTVRLNVVKPYDGQVVYFDDLYYTVKSIKIINSGDGYTTQPRVTIEPPTTSWGIPSQGVAEIKNGKLINVELISSGRGYTTLPRVTISAPNSGINTAVAVVELEPTYYSIISSSEVVSGICTVTLNDNIPYSVGIGSIVYFYKQSRILASGHSLEYIGSGTEIEKALPYGGGVPIQENEVVSMNGGLVVYTTTDQRGNFRIGDGVVINQQNGTVSGNAYTKSLFSTMTPFILALGGE